MHQYSDFFSTLHDERAPTGKLGRGTHYSILRAAVFSDSVGRPLKVAQFADFAIIWDEDHDERVIEAIEKIYFAGLLPYFLMFGERKGVLTAVLANDDIQPALWNDLDRELNDITQHLESEDSWLAQAFGLHYPPQNPIIDASAAKSGLYLNNLMMLWELGMKPAVFEPGGARAAQGGES